MSTTIVNEIEGNTLTVAQLAVSHPAALKVFTKYNIDYCCGGHRSLDEACIRIGLDPEAIKQEIYSSTTELASAFRPENWSSSLLIDFIIQNHHAYVREALPEIVPFLDKVCDAHGSDSPELLKIRENFLALGQELSDHMNKEEYILFPAIKRFEAQDNMNHPLSVILETPISAMEHEHVAAGELIKEIRSLSNNYTPPSFACPTFRITYQKLEAFENDLMMHIHLENNILFERIKSKIAGN